MIKQALKRILPTSLHRVLRRIYLRVRNGVMRPLVMRRARCVHSRLANQRPGRKTVVFFTPEAGVAAYLRTQAVIAKTLDALGHNVVFTRCFDLLPRCPVKDMVLLPYDASAAEQRNVCLTCYQPSEAILGQYELDFVDLREVLDERIRAKAHAITVSLPDNPFELSYEGINLGRLAFYDFAIAHKHPPHKPITGAALQAYRLYVENAVLAIEMIKALYRTMPFDVLACFEEYSMMSAARLYARQLGISVRMVTIAYHRDGDPGRIVGMSHPTIIKELAWRRSQWEQWRDWPLPPDMVAEGVGDVIHRLTQSGSNIYSPNKTAHAEHLLQHLSLSMDRKLLVAYTASGDEHGALLYNLRGLGFPDAPTNDAFGDTFEWLHALIEYVEMSADLQLVIRVHPRVGATSRDRLVSAENARYRSEFGKPYRHCRMIWPEEKVSSYDLAELADLALISWSTIGLELARMGIPVLSGHHSFMTIAPEENFIVQASCRDHYFEMLRRLLAAGAGGSETLQLCFRWYHMFYLGNSIDIGDLVTDGSVLPAFRLPKNASMVEQVFIGQCEAMDLNLASLRAGQQASSAQQEGEALRRQIGRFVEFICTGADPGGGVDLVVSSDMPPSPHMRGMLALDGRYVVYSDGRKTYRRYSPLVARLAVIAADLATREGRATFTPATPVLL